VRGVDLEREFQSGKKGRAMDRILVRKLRKEDAAQIGKIDAAITKMPDRLDFKRIVDDVARKEESRTSIPSCAGTARISCPFAKPWALTEANSST